jgi:hypothetical protein
LHACLTRRDCEGRERGWSTPDGCGVSRWDVVGLGVAGAGVVGGGLVDGLGGAWVGGVLDGDVVDLERDAAVAGVGDVFARFEAAGDTERLALGQVVGRGVGLGFPDSHFAERWSVGGP